MRLCHLADTHLGAGAAKSRRTDDGLTLRQHDIVRAFSEAVDRVIELRPDFCVHAGDLFDSVHPPNRIMAIAAKELHRLAAQAQIPTVIIAGNHDFPRQAHLAAPLEVFQHIDNLHIAARGRLESFVVGDTTVHALPHCLNEKEIQAELQRCLPSEETRYNVLVAHGVVAGMPEFSMADLVELELDQTLLGRFDYTAMGHYHNYRRVSDTICYAGATERLSQAEREHDKGFVEVDLAASEVIFHEVSTRPMVDAPLVDATGLRGDALADLIEQRVGEIGSADKIVRLNIKGISEETLKTIPTRRLAELKEQSFDLNLQFERLSSADDADDSLSNRLTSRLDQGFLEYIETSDLTGFDRERLRRLAIEYLGSSE